MRESRRPPSFTKHLVSAMKQGVFFSFPPFTNPRNTQSYESTEHTERKIVEDYFHDFDTQAKAS